MAASSYSASLARLKVHEGGYTDNPADPGGPTNWGVTIFDVRAYIKKDATAADVRALTWDQACTIYRKRYWDALACDDLPAGVDYAVFDYGVNSGIGRAGRVLRRCLRLGADASEAETVGAASSADCKKLIVAICDERLAFLRSLKTWDVFGRGWGARVAEIKAAALAMADPQSGPSPRMSNPAPHAAAAIAVAGSAVAAHSAGLPPLVIAFAAAAALLTAAIVYLCTRSKDETMWDKIKSAFEHSLTILWARIVALAGLLLALAEGVLADVNVNSAIQQALQPKYIPYYVIAIGLLTELARRRTAGRA